MTLHRGLHILEALAAKPDDGLAVPEICDELNAPRVSVHRLLSKLVDAGWVERQSRRYRLGPVALRVRSARPPKTAANDAHVEGGRA